MSHYFFDIYDGAFMRDDVGLDLPNEGAAFQQVWDTLPALIEKCRANDKKACQVRLDVRDVHGQQVFRAALVMAIEHA